MRESRAEHDTASAPKARSSPDQEEFREEGWASGEEAVTGERLLRLIGVSTVLGRTYRDAFVGWARPERSSSSYGWRGRLLRGGGALYR